MNPLVKKEIRLLLPSFLIGVALTFSMWLFRETSPRDGEAALRAAFFAMFPFLICPAMAVMMALESFGAEVSAGTFVNLLAQPVSRARIWQTKILSLAAALAIGGILWCTIFYLRFAPSPEPTDFGDVFLGAWLFLAVVFSGGLWTVLLLRQVAVAFWFTLLTPGAILAIIVGLFSDRSGEFLEIMAAVVLGLYSLAGFFFARWLFFRAQDSQWSGGTIALPEMRGVPAWLSRPVAGGVRHPRTALWGKEFQLHQSLFIIAGALLALHLGVLALKNFGHLSLNSTLEMVAEAFWGLWLVMPILVGAAAVAEERKSGTLAGQHCLPVKRRTQFAIKLSTVLLLSLLFGVVMPRLLEGPRILPDVYFFYPGFVWPWQMSTAQIFLWNCFAQINQWLPFLTLIGIALAFGAIAFYASTYARNTLQALGPAVLGIVIAFVFLIFATNPEEFFSNPPWRGWLVDLIGIPIMMLTLAALAFWNYKQIVVGWRMVCRNLFVLAAALALVLAMTTAIYHRAWEKLTPFEPAHGAPRFTLSNPPTLTEQWLMTSVRLPDGRIWTAGYYLDFGGPSPLAWLLGDLKMTSILAGHFLNGTNWVGIIDAGTQEQEGVKTDGTLWVSEHPAWIEQLATGEWNVTPGDLVRFGSESNWSSLAWNGLSILLVKDDGTLWRWGVTNWDFKQHKWPGMRAFTPYRLGTESNWAGVFELGDEPCLRKTDGSVWIPADYTPWYGNQKQTLELEPGFSVQRATGLEHGHWRSTTIVWNGRGYQLGVGDDGTFRIWADQELNYKTSYEWRTTDMQFGKDTNWLAVAGGYVMGDENIVTLKNDGTLWLWPFHHDYRAGWDPASDERELLDTRPLQLGTHSDWIAIVTTVGGITSLAADGTLWYWPLERPSFVYQIYNSGNGANSHFEPLLDISRKPQLLGNVFSAAASRR